MFINLAMTTVHASSAQLCSCSVPGSRSEVFAIVTRPLSLDLVGLEAFWQRELSNYHTCGSSMLHLLMFLTVYRSRVLENGCVIRLSWQMDYPSPCLSWLPRLVSRL
ncbi:hypothetical protein RRG08_033456 [Elysia crispata]|uniref:Uncharacterized protein n=1 Tax=Elysia crispata TaxID=231223 RepID=A0AAE1AUB2_9GAST|nr:hypothetical protein RRG08_033456 [Elysia crispata]